MIDDIEKLAVNSWNSSVQDYKGYWTHVAWSFFGIYRLALLKQDDQAAQVAQWISDLAFERSYMAEA